MLIDVIDDELDALACSNPAQSASSIEPSSFEYGPNWHDLLQFHVQIYSEILPHHESNKRSGFDVKKLENILREKICSNSRFRSEMDVNDENS